MSLYTTQAAVQAEVGLEQLIKMTDDSGIYQTVDVANLNQIISNMSGMIDGWLANIYSVPFLIAPPRVAGACLVFVCERLYKRRNTPDEINPYKVEADQYRKEFRDIGHGDMELDLNVGRNFYQGVVVGQPNVFGGSSPFNCGVGTTL